VQTTSLFFCYFGIDSDLQRENNLECAGMNPAYVEDWLLHNVQDLYRTKPRGDYEGLEIDEDDPSGKV
jgi:hypothetical protein